MEHYWVSTDMTSMRLQRRVLPERLDVMPADDPIARRSRRDLQRVHRVMRSLTILQQAVGTLYSRGQPRKILELGAGDGSLMLRLAQSATSSWRDVQITFLDRQDLISTETRRQFGQRDWDTRVLATDALDWAQTASDQQYDLCVTTLFLHHFESAALKTLMRAIAARCRGFVACEPRRNRFAWIGSHLLAFVGANEVTREDGVTSVVAGFADHELSALWPSPDPGTWQLREYPAWPFTHCFVADRSGDAEERISLDRAANPARAADETH
jgi:2-polyprenyl-3-methyl-5-hydroxy-6-metoxy-1,4-benzoquinol methylase